MWKGETDSNYSCIVWGGPVKSCKRFQTSKKKSRGFSNSSITSSHPPTPRPLQVPFTQPGCPICVHTENGSLFHEFSLKTKALRKIMHWQTDRLSFQEIWLSIWRGGYVYRKWRWGWHPGVTGPGSTPSLCTLPRPPHPAPDSQLLTLSLPLQGGALKAKVLELAQGHLSFLPEPEAENHCHPKCHLKELPKWLIHGQDAQGGFSHDPLSLALVPTKATEKLPPTQPWHGRPKLWRS